MTEFFDLIIQNGTVMTPAGRADPKSRSLQSIPDR